MHFESLHVGCHLPASILQLIGVLKRAHELAAWSGLTVSEKGPLSTAQLLHKLEFEYEG